MAPGGRLQEQVVDGDVQCSGEGVQVGVHRASRLDVGSQRRSWTPSSQLRTPWNQSSRPNAGQLAGFGEKDDSLGGWLGRLGPAAMLRALDPEVAHLALDHAGIGPQPPLGQPLDEDLGDRYPDRPGDLVRGKRPPGWPGAGARSAGCPQTTTGRGPGPARRQPGTSACGSRSGPAGAPRPPGGPPQGTWTATPPARRAGGSSTHPAWSQCAKQNAPMNGEQVGQTPILGREGLLRLVEVVDQLRARARGEEGGSWTTGEDPGPTVGDQAVLGGAAGGQPPGGGAVAGDPGQPGGGGAAAGRGHGRRRRRGAGR